MSRGNMNRLLYVTSSVCASSTMPCIKVITFLLFPERFKAVLTKYRSLREEICRFIDLQRGFECLNNHEGDRARNA